jgi:hypothetical protein
MTGTNRCQLSPGCSFPAGHLAASLFTMAHAGNMRDESVGSVIEHNSTI